MVAEFEVTLVYDDPLDRDTFQSILADLQYSDGQSPHLTNNDLDATLFRVAPENATRGSPDLPHCSILIDEYLFETDAQVANPVDDIVAVIKDVYFAGPQRPAFAYGIQHHVSEAMTDLGRPPIDAASLQEDRINYAVWLTVFPPRLVETYGRDALLNAQVWRCEQWHDGSILLVHDDDPLLLQSVKDLNDHLGLQDPGL